MKILFLGVGSERCEFYAFDLMAAISGEIWYRDVVVNV